MDIDFNPPIAAYAISEVDSRQSSSGSEVPSTEVFPQSVASGDPSPRGAILWTRISPNAYKEDIPLIVEVAEDGRFAQNSRQRIIDSGAIAPEHDYTVKVNLDESNLDLESDSWYYYRFMYDGVTSQIGRCRTLPARDATPKSIRFAVVTCRDYQNGYFGAYQHIAEETVDFLLDLGDFIYEVTDARYTLNRKEKLYPEHDLGKLPSEKGEKTGIAHDLRDYRYLYRTYHSNQFLQAALEQHTRIFIWDDHEFANNIFWDRKTRAPRAPGHPYDGDIERMRRLVRDALQAWWEYTPARVEYDQHTEEINDVITSYRTFQFGDLVTLIVTDERLYRTQPQRHLHRMKNNIHDRLRNRLPTWVLFPDHSEESHPTMLGKKQRKWFINEIHGSQARWTVWANEVLTLPMKVPLPYHFHDAWDGYESERKRIMQEIKASQMLVSHQAQKAGVRNFVTLTGDMHSYLAGYQRITYPQNSPVGVELMTGAMTSINIAEAISKAGSRIGNNDVVKILISKAVEPGVGAAISRIIPNIEFFNSHDWGYSVVTFTTQDCTYRAYSVDKTENSTKTEKKLITEIRIPDEKIEIQKTS